MKFQDGDITIAFIDVHSGDFEIRLIDENGVNAFK